VSGTTETEIGEGGRADIMGGLVPIIILAREVFKQGKNMFRISF
jgi:hypothetical protein